MEISPFVVVNLKLLGEAQRQTWDMGIRDGDNEEKYRLSRKEGEKRFTLTYLPLVNYYYFM